MCIPAGGGEGARDGEKNDLFTGGERVNGDGLELVALVEVCQVSVRNHVADCNRSHFPMMVVDLGSPNNNTPKAAL